MLPVYWRDRIEKQNKLCECERRFLFGDGSCLSRAGISALRRHRRLGSVGSTGKTGLQDDRDAGGMSRAKARARRGSCNGNARSRLGGNGRHKNNVEEHVELTNGSGAQVAEPNRARGRGRAALGVLLGKFGRGPTVLC